ncbi:conserved domain protein [Synechococcus sp. PCC 7335]|uniref:DUF928 domain-containing protein n=1 Tax=Synechococcus sp. (strain ATCC 29403 / PCC 7335) TaxID=91464 RepID=UPI00017EB4A5|nr:DUF928 domain-containing protein [Synechococcus sp. PCC 7335]EDX84499.1 conserved domain protein [Synechococcus sp. PCC 7335]
MLIFRGQVQSRQSLLSQSLLSQSLLRLSRNVLGVIVLSALSFFLSESAAAQQLPPLPIELDPSELINPGRPGSRRRDNSAKKSCQSSGLPLSAITYADTQVVTELGNTRTSETVGTLTTLARPSLWFYLPQALTHTSTEFVIRDSSDRLLYQGRLSGSADSDGIVAAPLPISLSFNTPYQWSVTVDCDETERTTVNGWIERRSPDPSLTNNLNAANSQNRAALYANAGFLQDALTELASLRNLRPNDPIIEQEWQYFLTALDVSELVGVPILECCEISNAPIEEPTEDPLLEDSLAPAAAREEVEDTQPIPTEPVEEDAQPIPTEPVEGDVRTILQRARDRG